MAAELRDSDGFTIARVTRDPAECSNCGTLCNHVLAFDNSKNIEPELFLCRVCLSILYDGLIKAENRRPRK